MIIDQIRTLGLDCEIDIQRTIQMVHKHNIFKTFFFITDLEVVRSIIPTVCAGEVPEVRPGAD